MNNYMLTVIILNYNQANLICDAIESMLMQKTQFAFQIIIADDHSTKDTSIELLQSYAEKYPEKITVLLAKENGKTLKNTLRALAITKTPYFTVLDGDDYLTDENHLQKAIDFLEANPDFAIYSTNVTCLDETGARFSYLKIDQGEVDSSFADYIKKQHIVGNTIGMVMRNVIYSKGIPEIIEKAVGTASERSFEGDTARVLMHLEKGKIHFVNTTCGVYRMHSSGIWMCLSEFDKHALHAQLMLDFNAYFDNNHKEFYINEAYAYVRECERYLQDIFNKADLAMPVKHHAQFFNALRFCLENKEFLEKKLPTKFRHKVLLKIYTYCHRKLMRKGLI